MAKYRVIKEAIAPFTEGPDRGKHFYPGSPHDDVVELNDGDPRVADWLNLGVIEKIGGRPKGKEEGE